jgi:hypothetical protein
MRNTPASEPSACTAVQKRKVPVGATQPVKRNASARPAVSAGKSARTDQKPSAPARPSPAKPPAASVSVSSPAHQARVAMAVTA